MMLVAAFILEAHLFLVQRPYEGHYVEHTNP